MRNNFKKIIFLLCLLPTLTSARIVYDPMNYIQNLIAAKNSVRQLLNQSLQIQNQIRALQLQQKNSKALGIQQWRSISQLIQRRMNSITQQGQALSNTMSNVEQKFQQQFPDYASTKQLPNYQQSYRTWNKTSLNTISNSLQAINASTQSAGREQQLMDSLKQENNSSVGQMQTLQISNEIAAEQVNQIRELNRLVALQTDSQSAYMARQVEEKSYQQESLQTIVDGMPTELPTKKYKGFGQIEVGVRYDS